MSTLALMPSPADLAPLSRRVTLEHGLHVPYYETGNPAAPTLVRITVKVTLSGTARRRAEALG